MAKASARQAAAALYSLGLMTRGLLSLSFGFGLGLGLVEFEDPEVVDSIVMENFIFSILIDCDSKSCNLSDYALRL